MIVYCTIRLLHLRRPRVRCFHLPPAIYNIEQLDCNKLLGVLLRSNFKMDMHVQNMHSVLQPSALSEY